MKELGVKFYQRLSLALLVLLVLVSAVLVVVFTGGKSKSGGEGARPATGASPEVVSPVEAEAMDYQSLFPELYAEEPVPSKRTSAKNTAYLTFDGAPGENTQAVLDILSAQGVKATFFVGGDMDEEDRALLREIAAQGHTVGLASATGSYEELYWSVETYLEDLSGLYQQVSQELGSKPQLIRFPGGSINAYNSGIYQELIAETLRRGFVFFDWNVSGADTRVEGADGEAIRASVAAGMEGKSRGIIKLNLGPGKEAVVEALPGIIEDLKAGGYQLEPLSTAVLPVVFSYHSAP